MPFTAKLLESRESKARRNTMPQAVNGQLENERLVKPERILVAIDATEPQRLIPFAVAQGRASGALVTLVHAIAPCQCSRSKVEGNPCAGQQRHEEIREVLKHLAEEVEGRGVSCTWTATEGKAVDVIQDQIAFTGATRLIMGSHARGKLDQLAFGSVANQLLGRIPIPIFLVGPHVTPSLEHLAPRRILHPVSMNGNYSRTAEMAVDLGALYGAEVSMLYVADKEMERSMQTGFALSWGEKLLSELRPDVQSKAAKVKLNVAFGDPVDEIRKEAQRIQAGWIVVGVSDDMFMWPLPESTAYRTLATADCPVLAVRHHNQSAVTSQENIADLVAVF
jgi:nucleotide-binding universal stress UspA family protein